MAMKIKGDTKNFARPLSNDLHREFIDWLGALGVEPDPKKGLVTGGEIGRAYTLVDGRRKQNAWYQVWFDQDRPYGHAERYDIGPLGTWKAEGADLPKLTKAQRDEIDRVKEQARLAQEVEQTVVAKKAQTMWDKAHECNIHPYLEAKGVPSHGLKQYKDALLIPLYNIHGSVQTLQFIDEDGKKIFLRGGKKKGGYFPIGIDFLADATVINYAEGYATAASYFAHHQQPVMVAFDAGNLQPVAEAIHTVYPKAKHVFIANFDESKTGEQKPIAAAQAIRQAGGHAEVLMPEQVGDYNDHAQAMKVSSYRG